MEKIITIGLDLSEGNAKQSREKRKVRLGRRGRSVAHIKNIDGRHVWWHSRRRRSKKTGRRGTGDNPGVGFIRLPS